MTAIEQEPKEWTLGRCWLYCRREGIPVKWIGPIRIPLGEAPMFGCADCRARLEALAEEVIKEADMTAALVSR